MVLLGMFGGPEILIIVFVLVLLFGAKRIPEMMRGMGKGIREFKDATNADEIKKDLNEVSGQINSTADDVNHSSGVSSKGKNHGK